MDQLVIWLVREMVAIFQVLYMLLKSVKRIFAHRLIIPLIIILMRVLRFPYKSAIQLGTNFAFLKLNLIQLF
ncbi:TPA: hypothetical protein JI078_18745 [Acinetobacter baumannii]|nr:hypothetical protein [Acinetobacter baumannii]